MTILNLNTVSRTLNMTLLTWNFTSRSSDVIKGFEMIL